MDAQHSVVGQAKGKMHMTTTLKNKLKLVTARKHMIVLQNKATGAGAASIP